MIKENNFTNKINEIIFLTDISAQELIEAISDSPFSK